MCARVKVGAARGHGSRAGAFAGTAAVRCDVAAPGITGALIRNDLENVAYTGRQL